MLFDGNDAVPGFDTWLRLCPMSIQDGPLAAIRAHLTSAEVRAELARCEAEERFPDRLVDELAALGLPLLFAAAPGAPYTTAYHMNALNALAAGASGSLAISLGITGLALLPVYIAGTDEQLAVVRERVGAGAQAAMLLSEWSHGSDLLAGETRAERAPDGYRVTGEKQLINMVARAGLLMTLARTAPPAAGLAGAGGLSLFLIDRDDTVEALPRRRTLPVPAAEIGGVRFRATHVPASRRIGPEGDGFRLVQAALVVSRGGISAFAAGTASRACALAFAYARERVLYGQPIAQLGPVAENLARMAALDLAAASLSVAAAAAVNALGQRAAHMTAVAKLVTCDLAERAVGEGRAVLSARSLLADLPYQQVVRDSMLYGVFDGTRHLMLDQVQWRVRRMARPAEPAEPARADIYRPAPAPMTESARVRGSAWLPRPSVSAAALAATGGAVDLDPLCDGARALEAATAALPGEAWADPGLAAGLASAWAQLEAALAVAELADPIRRERLGMPALAAGPPIDPAALARLAAALIAGEALAGARAALAGAGISLGADAAEQALATDRARAAAAVRDAIREWS
jgi:alkylation response protein AidB-like acyl-CoA dehydrogenase